MDPKIESLIQQLDEKYRKNGQDLAGYLEGLLYSDYTPYWDYIHLDTLLSLQKPKTSIPDELIFIMYHQVTELYFRMILHELHQIADKPAEKTFLSDRLARINRYFIILTDSYNVMTEGMERQQFLQFRMALMPASGFQSAQYRKIEICSTSLFCLVDKDHREKFSESSPLEDMFNYIYWRAGATEIDTGNKTLTLRQFEAKYDTELLSLCRKFKDSNVWKKYLSLSDTDRQDPELLRQMKNLDTNVNVNWPLAHYRTAVKYLARQDSDVPATGGTNWQKYLPPRLQKRVFFPSLWTQSELNEWGKNWVMDAITPYQDRESV